MPETSFEQAYPFAVKAAAARAASAVLRGAVPLFEREDLEQECLLACWRALHLFDPCRASLRTFIERVTAARMIDLHRARTCRIRFQPIEDHDRQVGSGWAQDIHLRSDVKRVLEDLPASDREIALSLMEHGPAEVGRRLRLSRSTVYERMRHIRMAFVKAELGPEATRTRTCIRPISGAEEAL